MSTSHQRNKMYNSPIFQAVARAMQIYTTQKIVPRFITSKAKQPDPAREQAAIEKRIRKNSVRKNNFHRTLLHDRCVSLQRYRMLQDFQDLYKPCE